MAVATDLERFCTATVSIISPSLVLVTGDITHAKFPDNIFSQQFEEEWHSYQGVLKKCHVREKLPWLDLRGNHGSTCLAWIYCMVSDYNKQLLTLTCMIKFTALSDLVFFLQTALMFHHTLTHPIVSSELLCLNKNCCISHILYMYFIN